MPMRRHALAALMFPALLALPAAADPVEKTPPAPKPAEAKVGNFALIDHRGEFHELYYHEKDPETRALVLVVQGNGCPIVRQWIPELNRLAEAYGPRGVRFWMINANPQDSREDVA